MVHHTAIYSRHFTTDHHDWLIIFITIPWTLYAIWIPKAEAETAW